MEAMVEMRQAQSGVKASTLQVVVEVQNVATAVICEAVLLRVEVKELQAANEEIEGRGSVFKNLGQGKVGYSHLESNVA